MKNPKKKPVPKKTQESSSVMTLEEAAAYLRVAPEVLQVEAEAGRIPGLCFRGDWRFAQSALATALAQGNRPVANFAFSKPGEPISPDEIAYWAARRPKAGAAFDTNEDPEEFIAEIKSYRANQRGVK
jgi:hypothetical protein